MQGFGGTNGLVIKDKGFDTIVNTIGSFGVSSAHFNNGTFTLEVAKFAPTFLAAFKRVTDLRDPIIGSDVPLVVAMNSDESMLRSFSGKDNEADLRKGLKPELERGENVSRLLSTMFPDRRNAVCFYDEDTPFELYRDCAKSGFGMASLHKVGFGTNPSDKPIIGAGFFDWVYACPLPFDEKPIMHADTRNAVASDRQPDLVEKLTEVNGPHGAPYMTQTGLPLFKLPSDLAYLGLSDNRHPEPKPSV